MDSNQVFPESIFEKDAERVSFSPPSALAFFSGNGASVSCSSDSLQRVRALFASETDVPSRSLGVRRVSESSNSAETPKTEPPKRRRIGFVSPRVISRPLDLSSKPSIPFTASRPMKSCSGPAKSALPSMRQSAKSALPSMRQFFRGKSPRSDPICGLVLSTLAVNFSNALDFRFVEGGWQQCRDDMLAACMDRSFLSEKWIQNHYRLIVWKLASLERSFPLELGGRYLSYGRVLCQLKSRYLREYEKAERSILKKMLERDDAASRFMILCVCSTEIDDSGARLRLTDGWYTISASLDSHLCQLVREGKIFIGIKLRIFGASLSGAEEGVSPLENHTCSLLLRINGVRRARWDAPLGRQRSSYFAVSLQSVRPDGGIVPCLHVDVERQYPSSFLESANSGFKIVRNARAEDGAQSKFLRLLEIKMESKDIQRDEACTESSIVEKDRLFAEDERKVSAFFQVRVSEVSYFPASPPVSAVLRVWGIDEESLHLFSEGHRLKLLGVLVSKPFGADTRIRLSTCRSSAALPFRSSACSMYAPRANTMFDTLNSLKIKEEFDIVACLIAVGEPYESQNRFLSSTARQLFFATPDFILAVECVENDEMMFSSQLFRPNQLFTVCNLQCGSYHERCRVANATVSRETVFSTKPHRSMPLAESFAELQLWMQSSIGREHLAKCSQRVTALLNGNVLDD